MPAPLPAQPRPPVTSRRPAAHAFTLIELLVVVAIISSLIAILLPSLNKAMDASRRVACASNVRQLSVAALFYANDWKMYLPHRGTDAWAPSSGWFATGTGDYRHLWEPYLEGYEITSGPDDNDTPGAGHPVLWCPSNPWPFQANFGQLKWPHDVAADRHSTGYSFFANHNSTQRIEQPVMGMVQKLTDKSPNPILWSDNGEDKTAGGIGWRLLNHAGDRGSTEFSLAPPDGANTSRMDGSARWYEFSEMAIVATYANVNDWAGVDVKVQP